MLTRKQLTEALLNRNPVQTFGIGVAVGAIGAAVLVWLWLR